MQTFYFRTTKFSSQPQPNVLGAKARSLADTTYDLRLTSLASSTLRFADELCKAHSKAKFVPIVPLRVSKCFTVRSNMNVLKLWRCKTACKMMDGVNFG